MSLANEIYLRNELERISKMHNKEAGDILKVVDDAVTILEKIYTGEEDIECLRDVIDLLSNVSPSTIFITEVKEIPPPPEPPSCRELRERSLVPKRPIYPHNADIKK
ncbi:MAG: hypothetical protein RR280_08545 [Bacteroidaceae bacterium]